MDMKKHLMKIAWFSNGISLFVGVPVLLLFIPTILGLRESIARIIIVSGSIIAVILAVLFYIMTAKRLSLVFKILDKMKKEEDVTEEEKRKSLISLLNIPYKSSVQMFFHFFGAVLVVAIIISFQGGFDIKTVLGILYSLLIVFVISALVYMASEHVIHPVTDAIMATGVDIKDIRKSVFKLSIKKRITILVVLTILLSVSATLSFPVSPLVSILTIIVIIGLAFYTIKIILVSIAIVYSKLDKVEDSNMIYPLTFDEIGDVIEKLRNFMKNLFMLLKGVKVSTNKVFNYANNLAASSQEISASIEEISSTLQDVAESTNKQTNKMGELTKEAEKLEYLAGNIKSKVKMASESAHKTSQLAEKGINSVKLTVESMGHIYDSTLNSKQIVENLVKKTEEIQEILSIITDIAEQTDLLALNAAIEAARVGEQGKGFAVVADHIRKLAIESSNATERISSMLDGIRTEMEKAQDAMDKQNEAVEEGRERVSDVHSKLEEITESVTLTVSMVKDIESSADDQFAATTSIKTLISETYMLSENIAANTQEISASIEEQMASIEELSSMAQDMNDAAKSLGESISLITKE